MENVSFDTITESQQAMALAYLKGEMTESEREAFEEDLTRSEALREELIRSRALLDALASAQETTIVEIVFDMIREAIRLDATDIHILPQRKDVQVQVRVDGVLRELMRLPRKQQGGVIDRWKMMADMHIGENRVPQDGRIPLKHEGKDLELRVNILPTLYGERVTAHIRDRSRVLIGLDALELSAAPARSLRRLAALESGLILTGGPAGVGKTTLLYSLLLEMQSVGRAGRSLMTVEDPIEYQLQGVSQTGVDKKYDLTFSAALRSMLRCDPDVILCGAMRDLESAELSVEIALTGRLLLSALHTTSALGIIQRLRDIGVENFLIADTLAGVICQRLVRRTDATRTEEYHPDDLELAKAGMTRADGPFIRGVATGENSGTGFKGRIPLVEVMEITPVLRRMIVEKAPIEELWRAAFHNSVSIRDDANVAARVKPSVFHNSVSLREDGRARIKAGLTTVEEVNRALSDYPF